MEALLQNLVKAIGWSIIHSLWQGALIYALLLVIKAVQPTSSSRYKHNMAFGAMFVLLASFCTTFILIFQLPVTHLLYDTPYSPAMYNQDQLNTLKETITKYVEHSFPFLSVLYFFGILLQIVSILSGYRQLSKLKRSGCISVPTKWNDTFDTVKTQLKLHHRKIGFYLSEYVNVPLVIGYFKPMILFPVALVVQLEITQVEAILIHELSHIRRNDYLFNLLKKSIETVLFFNPFIWLVGKSIQIERENACDDLVIKLTCNPMAYAQALLKLEILKTVKQDPALSIASTGNKQYLYERIKRITAMKTNHISAKQQLFAFTLIILTVISLAWISPAESRKNKRVILKTTAEVSQQHSVTKIKSTIEPGKIHAELSTDTPKKKIKIKILAVDPNGKKKEYNSLKDLPDSLKTDWLTMSLDDHALDSLQVSIKNVNKIAKSFQSPEWKIKLQESQKLALEMNKWFNSPEWKNQQEQLQKQALEITKQFNSPEWKQHQEAFSKNAVEMGKQLQFKLKGLQLKQNIAEKMRTEADKSRLQFEAKELRIFKNDDAWKKKAEEIRELRNSAEYQKLKQKFDKDLEKIKKKKGISADLNYPDGYVLRNTGSDFSIYSDLLNVVN